MSAATFQEESLPISNLQQLENYLSFYRQKLDAFEQERIEWQQDAEQMRLQIERSHTFEHEILDKKREISEIQKALSDSRLSIYDERQQFMKLKREFDLLLNQDREDQRRIRELMSLNEDIENTNTNYVNFKDCRPGSQATHGHHPASQSLFSNTTIAESQHLNSTMNRSQKAFNPNNRGEANNSNTLAINKSQQVKESLKKKLKDQHSQHFNQVQLKKNTVLTGGNTMMRTAKTIDHQGSGIIKTVILPNEEINRLGVEAEELRLFLAAQQQVFEQSVQAYDQDRLIREQEFKLKEEDFKEKISVLKTRLAQRQEVNYGLTKDYFDYKHVVNKTKQRLQDEYDLVKVENQALKQQLDKILETAKIDTQYSQSLYQQKTSNFASRFRKQSKENEEDLNIVKLQYGQVQEKYISELKALESNLAFVIEKAKLLDNRRSTEQTAFVNDIGTLKRKVNNYEKFIKELKILVEEEKTQQLVHRLQGDEIDSLGVQQALDEIQRIEQEVKESKRFNIHQQSNNQQLSQ